MKMTLSHHYLKVNLNLLDALGYPKAHAYDILEIDESALALPHERLSLENFQACLSAAAEFTGDNNIGLRLGHKFRVSAYGETGSLYAYCEDLEEVISMNNLYQKIAIDAGQVEYLQNTNGTHHMCFRPYYSNASEYRLLTDVILASFITAYRWLSWGSGEDIICTHLPYVPQDQIQTYSDILQTPVKRDLNEICVQFSDVAMSQKITTRNPERLAQARFKLDKLLGGHIASSAFEDAVEAAIRAALEAGSISSDVVANRLGLSGSVFRARLAATFL